MRFNSRFKTGPTNSLIDTVTTAVDCTILCAQDNLDGIHLLDIAREAWEFRDDHDNLIQFMNVNFQRNGRRSGYHLEFPAFLCSTDNSF